MNARVTIINIASLVAILSLLIGLLAAIMAFSGAAEIATYKLILNLSSLAWFITSPLWFVPHLFGDDFAQAGKRAWLRPKGG